MTVPLPSPARTDAHLYRPRCPEGTLLYQTVLAHLETFLQAMEDRNRPLPFWVEERLRAFLRCGLPHYGFVRVRCYHCKIDRAVPFSCKGRGLCPSCGGRRMADLAAHWVDHVLPHLPMRQWVLTLPWELRYRLAWDPDLLADVLKVYLRVIFSWQRRQALKLGLKSPQSGAITAIQRFGSALNLNIHFHSIVPDGIFVEKTHGVEFVPLPEPSSEQIGIVVATVRRRVLRLLHRRGLYDAWSQEPDLLLMNEPALATLYGASVQGRLALGARAGQKVQRLGAIPGAPWVEMNSPQCARVEGFSLHAQVAIEAHERESLERLCRYIARPPLANSRLTRMPDGKLCYELARMWQDGTHCVLFEPLELLEKLVALIPRPWTHLVRYHGVFAPNARLRAAVIPVQPKSHGTVSSRATSMANNTLQPRPRRRTLPWAELMRRVFMVDVLCCAWCQHSMTIVSVLTDPKVVEPFLLCLGWPASPPQTIPAAPARGPPWLN